MAKGLNKEYIVNLAFTADTNSAKQQLQDLQNSLTKLVNTSAFKNKDFGLDKDLQNASAAAARLKVELDNAINTDTGKLDLTKFMDSLKKSNMSIKDYQNQLYQLGPDGEKAFTKLSQAITLAEVPLKRTSSLMSELWTTMKNTARWQLTSSTMHSFIGAIQHAYYYAQDLNESLNNIRIVSSASVEQMDKFAEKANKAAKSLSSTTLDYTNAALIYYQQGLTDKEVADRTEVTLKMANAARESATTISDQLTSVWNNFYDGSESLEHYADAMVRLGADTASSSSEISEGLQKFSSVASTIGLSFDNAAAALATITATTRESADIVGTALKTLFSRIQGLKLGKTLDDGTDLNKYSTALHKVGIEVKDTDGQLKDMDVILDEMGTKWNTWSRDTQMALAQTVAGVRQYTQLMTLMNNYDFYKENVERAKNSEGSLQEQADIYAESWEAAKDRVKTSLQTIYKSLINDQFFIEFNNKIGDILDGINTFIKSLGGIKGILLTVGGIFMSVFQKQIATSLSNMIFNVKNLGIEIANLFRKNKLSNPYDDFKKQVNQQLIEGYKDTNDNGNNDVRITMYKALAKNQLTYLDNVDKMDAKEQAINQQLMDRNRLLAEQAIKGKENLNNLEDQIKQEMKSLAIQAQLKAQNTGKTGDFMGKVQSVGANTIAKGKQQSFVAGLNDYTKQYKNLSKDSEEYAQVITNIKTRMSEFLGLNLDDTLQNQLATIDKAFGENSRKAADWKKYWKEISNSKDFDLSVFSNEIDDFATKTNVYFRKSLEVFQNVLKSAGFEGTELDNIMKNLTDRLGVELTGAIKRSSKAMEDATGVMDRHNESMKKAAQKPITFGQAFISAAGMITSCVQVINTLTHTLDILNDEEASTKDKIIALATGIGSIIPAIVSIASGFKAASGGVMLFGNSVKITFPILLAIEVAIAAIIGLLYALNKELKNASPEGQLKKTKKAVEELTTAEQEAKEAADNLRSAIEAYDSAIEKLEDCKRGTEEWRDALLEANKAAVDIINTASGLSGEDIRDLYSRNSDGLIEFNKEGLQTLQNQADENAQLASYSLASAQYNNSQAQNKRDADNLSNQIYDNTLQYDDQGNAYSLNTSKEIQQIILDNLDNLSKSMPIEEFKNNLLDLGIDLQYVTDNELAAWQESIQGMATEADKASAKLELVANLKADELLGDDYTSEEKDFAAKENAAFIASQTAFYKTLMEHDNAFNQVNKATGETVSLGGINRWSGTENDVYQYVLKALQDAGQNIFAASSQAKAVQGTDNNRSFGFLKDGKEITLSSDEIANILAASDAIQQMGNSASKARELFSEFSGDALNQVTTLVNDFNTKTNEIDFTQVLADFTTGDLNTIKDQINTALKDEDVNLTQLIADVLQWDPDQVEHLLSALGITGEDCIQAILDGAEGAIGSVSDEVSAGLKETYSDDDITGMTVGQQTGLYNAQNSARENIKKVYTNGNDSLLADIGKQNINAVGADNLIAFFNEVGTLDFGIEGSSEKLQELVKQYGISGDAIDSFTHTVSEMPVAYKTSTDDIIAQNKKIADVVGSGLDFGDTIKADEAKVLEEAGINLDTYFTKMADGTYKLTGDAEQFNNMVSHISVDAFIDNLQKYQAAKQENGLTLETLNTDNSTWNSNHAIGEKRLNYLNSLDLTGMGIDNASEIQALAGTSAIDLSVDDLNLITEALKQVNEYETQTQATTFQLATSLNELDSIAAQMGTYSLNAYGEGLISVASQYDNCTQEIEKFKIALSNGDEAVIENTEDLLRASIAIGEAGEKYDIDAKAAEVQAKQLAKAYNLNAEAAAKMAINNARMNKGVESLVDNWSDWKKALKATDKTTLDYAKAVKETTAAIADLVGASSDLELPEEFFNDKNYKLIDKAIQGDSKAIDTLGLEVAKAQTKALEFNEAMAQVAKEGIDGASLFSDNFKLDDLEGSFDAAKTIVTNAMSEIQGYINSGLSTEQINAKIHSMNEDWITALNDMAMATGMSVDDMNSILGSMGVQAKVDTKYVPQEIEVPMYAEKYESTPITATYTDDQGQTHTESRNEWVHYTVPMGAKKVSGYVAVAQISTEDNPMTAETTTSGSTGGGTNSGATYTGHGSVSSSATKGSKGGGGGSKSKASKKDLTKKSDVVDRYKEIDDSIHDLTRALDKGNKAADRMWGKSRISAMKANNKMLQDEIGLLNKKAEEAKKYLALDKQELLLAAKKAGVNFQFDEDGDISNYTQEMTRLYDELHAAEEHINSLKTKEAQDEYEESVLKAIEDKIAELKSALSQYEETKSLIEDLEDEAEDKFYEWQDNNFEILNHELEVKITLDDNELKKLDYFFNKLSDNIYKAAEALGYLQGQIDPTFGKMKSYEDYYNSLESSYANGEISQAAYVEGLQDAYDSIIDNLEAVQDLDKQMLEYYGNTLDLAEEELSKYTDQMEHLTSVLDHYRSILSLLGRDTDYTRVLTVLEGNAQTKRNKFDTSKAWYESLKAERDAAAAALAQASDDAERELLQKNYDAIVAKFNEAEEQMLSDAEAYGEAIKEVLTTKMEQAAENMNKAMTDGMGWDALNDSLDRLSKYQDEYLTKTNQIYEMNKLLNDVNKASNKTNNQAAKDKYYQFSKEIEQLREKDKLSQLELDIAQAKYKVLQAQIALDEAQNAMGKVRLQRDNEGNFGYVYTADQDKIDDAQQALADAENDLYNIRLDATNKYGQQKLQYEQELAEKLKEIDEKANEDALYREGNYQADRQRIIDEYTQLIQASSDLYRIAQEEDSRVVQDAWVNAYDEIIDSGDQWKTAIIDYTGQINNAFQEWQAETDRLTDLVGKDLVDTKNKVNDVTNASDQLKDEVINKVVPALTQELQAVRNATEAYARQRQEIMNLISYYEQLISKIQQAIAAQASMDAGSNSSSSDYDDYDPSVDYSALMGTVPVGSELYNKYKAYRDRKMSEGNYDNMASTARINKFYEMGYKLGEGKFTGYTNFTQIPDWLWEETVGKTFRTGGYTGSWGESGKLAVLHEKELVLNKEDTQNMLSSIKMVREIASEIDLRSRYTTMPINPIYSTFGTGNDILEQQVHIDASFPNVTDRNEIQEAFNTLINVASQYANRK